MTDTPTVNGWTMKQWAYAFDQALQPNEPTTLDSAMNIAERWGNLYDSSTLPGPHVFSRLMGGVEFPGEPSPMAMEWANTMFKAVHEDMASKGLMRPTDMDTEQVIAATGANTAPRVTPADIEAQIVSEHYFTANEAVYGEPRPKLEEREGDELSLSLLTFCVLVLRNGFTVTGESACASPENFNAEKGRDIARQHAVEKVWPLLGYELRTRLGASAVRRAIQKAEFDKAALATAPPVILHDDGSIEFMRSSSVTAVAALDDARSLIDSQPVETKGRTFYDPRTGQWHGPAAPKGGAWSDGSSADAPLETGEADARPYPKAPDA